MVNCQECNAKCCRYVSTEIDRPASKEDFDDIKWFLCHKNVIVYIDNEDEWVVEFKTECKYLDENKKCKIYDKRPRICREHDTEDCDVNGSGEDCKVLFKEPEEIDRYYEEVFLKRKNKIIINPF